MAYHARDIRDAHAHPRTIGQRVRVWILQAFVGAVLVGALAMAVEVEAIDAPQPLDVTDAR